MAIPSKRLPRRGEIWFVKLHVDSPDKGLRPVLIVSVDARNQHERADTVLAIPLTTSVRKRAAFATPADRKRAHLPAWASHPGSAWLRSVKKAFN
jgi:mRNA-degrading endonuclease toxin of MazEF toxin-antitoxin module